MSYRLNKSAFKIQSFEEADNQSTYWSNKSFEERLKSAAYLIGSAYQCDFLKMKVDKSVFRAKKRG